MTQQKRLTESSKRESDLTRGLATKEAVIQRQGREIDDLRKRLGAVTGASFVIQLLLLPSLIYLLMSRPHSQQRKRLGGRDRRELGTVAATPPTIADQMSSSQSSGASAPISRRDTFYKVMLGREGCHVRSCSP